VTDGQARLTGCAKVEVRAPAGRPGGGERPREASGGTPAKQGGGAPAKPEDAKDPAAAKTTPANDTKDTPRR